MHAKVCGYSNYFIDVLTNISWRVECKNAPLNFEVAVSVTKLCPLYNVQTIQDIIMKLHRNINQHWMTCIVQES